MSFLNYESTVINTKAKITSLPLTLSRSMEHGLPHGLQHQHSIQWQYIDMVLYIAQASDTIEAFCRCTGQAQQHGLRMQ